MDQTWAVIFFISNPQGGGRNPAQRRPDESITRLSFLKEPLIFLFQIRETSAGFRPGVRDAGPTPGRRLVLTTAGSRGRGVPAVEAAGAGIDPRAGDEWGSAV